MLKLAKFSGTSLEIGDISLTSISDMKAYIGTIIQTSDLGTSLRAFQYKNLPVSIDIYSVTNINIYISGHAPRDFYIQLAGHSPIDFLITFLTVGTGDIDLITKLHAVHSEFKDLEATLLGWGYKNLPTYLGGHPPEDLTTILQALHERFLTTYISGHFPARFSINLYGQPGEGTNLYVTHGITERSNLSIILNAWAYVYDLPIYLIPARISDLSCIIGTSGGYRNITAYWNGKSGWKNLYVAIRPNIRRLTTTIPIHMMEYKHLYVSINDFYPCTFGSAYKNLFIIFEGVPDNILKIYIHGIRGSGYRSLKVYINKEDFNWYMDNIPMTLILPLPNPTYFEFKRIKFDSLFEQFYYDKQSVSFDLPRRHILGGDIDLTILMTLLSNRYNDLIIYLKPLRHLPPVLQSKKEVELWSLDPPELVRIIEILFEQQVHEYIWESTSQRAYSRELWEKWCLMSRGYLPKETYGGQIDYITMTTLCNIQRFSTIDEAIRWLIEKAVISDYTSLYVYLDAKRYIKDLEIYLKPIDKIEILRIYLTGVYASDLNISLTPV